jgi:hypothetical protein
MPDTILIMFVAYAIKFEMTYASRSSLALIFRTSEDIFR